MDFQFGAIITSEQYKKFRNMDLSQHVRSKGNLSYLPWGVAMDVMKATDANLDVSFESNPETNQIVFGSPDSGYFIQAYMVNYELKTRTTPMYHALRDYKNKAITGTYSVTDLTNSIQRATAKVIATQTGIAMQLYSQIDEGIDEVISEPEPKAAYLSWKKPSDAIDYAVAMAKISKEDALLLMTNTEPDEKGSKAINFYKEIQKLLAS